MWWKYELKQIEIRLMKLDEQILEICCSSDQKLLLSGPVSKVLRLCYICMGVKQSLVLKQEHKFQMLW
jgi:hypothetical protein